MLVFFVYIVFFDCFVIVCLCLFMFVCLGGCETIKSALRYKSPQQELNLSGSKDKPSLTLTGLRCNKVVYKGFIKLYARKAIKFGVGPKPIATREHRVK